MSSIKVKKVCLSLPFIPGTATSVAQINPIGEHGECFGCESDFLRITLRSLRPGKSPGFKPFGHHPKSRAIEEKDLNAVAAFVRKDEKSSFARVEPELVLRQSVKAVEALTHVAGFDGEIDFETAGK